jgi:endonuclease/exonuclease/phosphatase family metal-dependent hydrolase
LTVRVVTYNVRGFRDGRDRVAAVVHELAPDVLLLQETGPRRELRRFASSLGMRVARDPRTPFRRRVKNAVLVTDPWMVGAVRLVRFERAVRWYPRGALVTRIRSDAGSVWAISVHLGLDGDERGEQVDELVRLVESLGNDVVFVGGDLNATPDRPAVARLAAILRDAWHEAGEGDGETFPAVAPTDRIDYVFVRGSIQIRSVRVGAPGAEAASDHLPVSAGLALDRP